MRGRKERLKGGSEVEGVKTVKRSILIPKKGEEDSEDTESNGSSEGEDKPYEMDEIGKAFFMGPSLEITGSRFLSKRFTLRGIRERFSIVGNKAILSITRKNAGDESPTINRQETKEKPTLAENEAESPKRPSKQTPIKVETEEIDNPKPQTSAEVKAAKPRHLTSRESALNHMVYYLNQPGESQAPVWMRKPNKTTTKLSPDKASSQILSQEANETMKQPQIDSSDINHLGTPHKFLDTAKLPRICDSGIMTQSEENNPYITGNLCFKNIDILELKNLDEQEVKEIIEATEEEKDAHQQRIRHLENRLEALKKIVKGEKEKESSPDSPAMNKPRALTSKKLRRMCNELREIINIEEFGGLMKRSAGANEELKVRASQLAQMLDDFAHALPEERGHGMSQVLPCNLQIRIGAIQISKKEEHFYHYRCKKSMLESLQNKYGLARLLEAKSKDKDNEILKVRAQNNNQTRSFEHSSTVSEWNPRFVKLDDRKTDDLGVSSTQIVVAGKDSSCTDKLKVGKKRSILEELSTRRNSRPIVDRQFLQSSTEFRSSEVKSKSQQGKEANRGTNPVGRLVLPPQNLKLSARDVMNSTRNDEQRESSYRTKKLKLLPLENHLATVAFEGSHKPRGDAYKRTEHVRNVKTHRAATQVTAVSEYKQIHMSPRDGTYGRETPKLAGGQHNKSLSLPQKCSKESKVGVVGRRKMKHAPSDGHSVSITLDNEEECDKVDSLPKLGRANQGKKPSILDRKCLLPPYSPKFSSNLGALPEPSNDQLDKDTIESHAMKKISSRCIPSENLCPLREEITESMVSQSTFIDKSSNRMHELSNHLSVKKTTNRYKEQLVMMANKSMTPEKSKFKKRISQSPAKGVINQKTKIRRTLQEMRYPHKKVRYRAEEAGSPYIT